MNTNQNSNNKAKRNGMLCIWILCWCFVRAFNEHWALFKSIAWQCMMNWSIHDSQSLFSICMHWTVCLFVLHSQILSQYWYMTYAAQWMRKSILLGAKKHNTKVPMNVGNTVKAKQQIESKYFGEKSGRITTHTHTHCMGNVLFFQNWYQMKRYTHTLDMRRYSMRWKIMWKSHKPKVYSAFGNGTNHEITQQIAEITEVSTIE